MTRLSDPHEPFADLDPAVDPAPDALDLDALVAAAQARQRDEQAAQEAARAQASAEERARDLAALDVGLARDFPAALRAALDLTLAYDAQSHRAGALFRYQGHTIALQWWHPGWHLSTEAHHVVGFGGGWEPRTIAWQTTIYADAAQELQDTLVRALASFATAQAEAERFREQVRAEGLDAALEEEGVAEDVSQDTPAAPEPQPWERTLDLDSRSGAILRGEAPVTVWVRVSDSAVSYPHARVLLREDGLLVIQQAPTPYQRDQGQRAPLLLVPLVTLDSIIAEAEAASPPTTKEAE